MYVNTDLKEWAPVPHLNTENNYFNYVFERNEKIQINTPH